MKNYLVTIRFANGKKDFIEYQADSEFDVRQQAGWDYVREAVVINVEEQ